MCLGSVVLPCSVVMSAWLVVVARTTVCCDERISHFMMSVMPARVIGLLVFVVWVSAALDGNLLFQYVIMSRDTCTPLLECFQPGVASNGVKKSLYCSQMPSLFLSHTLKFEIVKMAFSDLE